MEGRRRCPGLSRQRHILVHADILSRAHQPGLAFPDQPVADIDLAFLNRDERGVLVVLDDDVEHGTAHRDHCGGGEHAIRIRLTAEFLNEDLHPPEPEVEQVPPVARVIPERHPGVREHLKGAAVGKLEHGKTVRAGEDHLPPLDGVTHLKRPRVRIPQNGNLAGKRDHPGSAQLRRRRGQGGTERKVLAGAHPRRHDSGQPSEQPNSRPTAHTQTTFPYIGLAGPILHPPDS